MPCSRSHVWRQNQIPTQIFRCGLPSQLCCNTDLGIESDLRIITNDVGELSLSSYGQTILFSQDCQPGSHLRVERKCRMKFKTDEVIFRVDFFFSPF